MDGPSRRAPGATMEGGHPAQPGRMQGQAFCFLLGDCKREAPGRAKQGLAARSIISWAEDVLATLNADIANSFAKDCEAAPFRKSTQP